MSLFGNIVSGGAGLLTGRIWQVAAIGLFVALVTSSSYLGYQWHQAASDRDENIKWLEGCNEAKLALAKEIGMLEGTIKLQNDSIALSADLTAKSGALYDQAMTKADAYGKTIAVLRKDLAARAPSLTCDSALKRQREAIDYLKTLRNKEPGK